MEKKKSASLREGIEKKAGFKLGFDFRSLIAVIALAPLVAFGATLGTHLLVWALRVVLPLIAALVLWVFLWAIGCHGHFGC